MEPGVADRIVCGIAGWSYPDWDGYVYPAGTRDKLHYVAQYVGAIEVNSTFYRPPVARTTADWVRRTADRPRLVFTAKLHQDLTHGAGWDDGLVRACREGFQPLVESGRLRHLLAQFAHGFQDTPAARARLAAIRDGFGDLANLAVEVRHGSWQAPAALAFLRDLGVTVAALDYPLARDSFRLEATGIGAHAYLRLHGRNAAAWFDRQAGRDATYNHLYSGAELDEIAARAARIASMSQTLTLVANNHYQGKEAVAALELTARFTGKPVDVPPPLLARYPHLRAVACPPAGELGLF